MPKPSRAASTKIGAGAFDTISSSQTGTQLACMPNLGVIYCLSNFRTLRRTNPAVSRNDSQGVGKVNQIYLAVNRSVRTRVAARLASGFALAAGLLCISGTAHAAYGDRGNISIGAERLFGFYSNHESVEFPAPLADLSTTSSQIGLFYQQPSSAFAIPRLTFDYFIADHFSLGTALGYYQTDPDDNVRDKENGFILAPRVGYAFLFSDKFGVHPHGGFTYVYNGVHFENDDETSESQLAVSLDGTFFYMPAPNVGFTASLVLDLGLTGTYENAQSQEFTRHEQLVGVSFGMFAHF
jgi:hypothetical protein